MILEAQNKKPVQVDNFKVVEAQLRALKSYGRTSFASLSKADGSFIQVAGGRVACVLERSAIGANGMERAFLHICKSPFKGTQTLMCGAGHIQHSPDESLFIDDVISCFKAFFDGAEYPPEIGWRSHGLAGQAEK